MTDSGWRTYASKRGSGHEGVSIGRLASLTPFSAWASCKAPPTPPAPPSGVTATREEMLAAQSAIKGYNAAVVEYRGLRAEDRRQRDRDINAVDRSSKSSPSGSTRNCAHSSKRTVPNEPQRDQGLDDSPPHPDELRGGARIDGRHGPARAARPRQHRRARDQREGSFGPGSLLQHEVKSELIVNYSLTAEYMGQTDVLRLDTIEEELRANGERWEKAIGTYESLPADDDDRQMFAAFDDDPIDSTSTRSGRYSSAAAELDTRGRERAVARTAEPAVREGARRDPGGRRRQESVRGRCDAGDLGRARRAPSSSCSRASSRPSRLRSSARTTC